MSYLTDHVNVSTNSFTSCRAQWTDMLIVVI